MAYIGRGLDKISNVEKLDNLTFDGSSTSYSLLKGGVSFTPSSANNILLSIDGVVQAGNFTVSGSTIDFGVAVSASSTCDFIIHYGVGVITTPSDNSVTAAKIPSGTISNSHLATTSINSQTAEATIADDDEVLIYDTSASALRKMTRTNFVSGVGGTNTPLVAVRASTGQSISSGTNTKVQLDTEMIDTDNTFDSSTNYRWSPGVAGKYYITATTSVNINVAGKYLQALIYKNGSLASYQQVVAEGNNATYNATADLIDDNDGDDYYELYIRQNTGGSISLNHSATGLYTRFFGYKLLT